MVQVLHTLTCENCGFEETSCDTDFGIDDVLEFRYNCANEDECSLELCQNCSKNCEKCNEVYCENCIGEHSDKCSFGKEDDQ